MPSDARGQRDPCLPAKRPRPHGGAEPAGSPGRWRGDGTTDRWAMTMALPVPPENLRVTVGPFSDGGLFACSGDEMVSDIVALCDVAADACVLEVGCGCGRLARAFASHIASGGSYHGFDLSREAIAWCRQELQPRLANFRFAFVD